jgi:hypothetical protein
MTARQWLQGLGIVLMGEAAVGRFGRWFRHYDAAYHFHYIVFLVGAAIFVLTFVVAKDDGDDDSGAGSGA